MLKLMHSNTNQAGLGLCMHCMSTIGPIYEFGPSKFNKTKKRHRFAALRIQKVYRRNVQVGTENLGRLCCLPRVSSSSPPIQIPLENLGTLKVTLGFDSSVIDDVAAAFEVPPSDAVDACSQVSHLILNPMPSSVIRDPLRFWNVGLFRWLILSRNLKPFLKN